MLGVLGVSVVLGVLGVLGVWHTINIENVFIPFQIR